MRFLATSRNTIKCARFGGPPRTMCHSGRPFSANGACKQMHLAEQPTGTRDGLTLEVSWHVTDVSHGLFFKGKLKRFCS